MASFKVSRIPESRKFCFAIPNPINFACKFRTSASESGIQLKESGILLTIGIWNPNSTDKESEIQHLESRIQDCLRLPYMG